MTYNNDLIIFFKRHNMYEQKMFKYLETHTTMIDYQDEEQRPYIGTKCIVGKQDNILKGIYLCLPYVYNGITMLISIHELVHAIIKYKMLNKKYKVDITEEALPMLYEKIYLNESKNQQAIKYVDYLDELIDNSVDQKYIFGLETREELLKNYNYNIGKMQKLTKKLAKKYPKEHK